MRKSDTLKLGSREKGCDVMAVLATPKKNSYIIKKDCADAMIHSRTSAQTMQEVQKWSKAFQDNNLKHKS